MRYLHWERWIGDGITWVAVLDGRVVGYIVGKYTFFSYAFIGMLYVNADHRRKGIATALVRQMEDLCTTDRIFTSTNESNRPMQAFMLKLGYAPSGLTNGLNTRDHFTCLMEILIG